MRKHTIEIPDYQLAEFCRRWQITELAVFGSILRNDFQPESDVDFLDTVWDTATNDVVALLSYLAPLVSPLLTENVETQSKPS